MERIVLKPVPAHVKSFDVSQRVLKNHGAVCKDLGCEVRSFKANPKNGHGQALKGKMERCWQKSGKPSMLRSKYCWRTTSAPKLRIAGLIVTPLDASKSATSAPWSSPWDAAAVSTTSSAACSIDKIEQWTVDPGRWTWANNDAPTPRCLCRFAPPKKGSTNTYLNLFSSSGMYGPKLCWITFVLMSCLHMIVFHLRPQE